MATLQSKIPFRSRKSNYVTRKVKKEKENEDITNEDLPKINGRVLKRQHDKSESDEESCSPTKVSRFIARQNATNNILSETKRNDKPLIGLTSRETETTWLHDFLKNNLEKKQSASLYISGQPGTGKTASLNYLLQLPEFKNSFRHVYVNCTLMKTAGSIYKRLCSELQLKTTGSSEKACLSSIEKYFSSKHKMTLIVLDEIDQLCNKRQSVLYSLFEWPSRENANLILVGVANTLDFVPRVLPRLLTNRTLPPQTLHFAPYTKQQIIDIFENKIAQENKGIVFAPVALQMIAAKISAISGDVRRALDVAQRVVEIAKRNQDGASKVTVELKHALEVLDLVYGNPKNIQNNVDEGLPIHQKLILCSLMLMFTKGKTKHVTLSSLYDVYKRVSRGRNITALSMSEFVCTSDLLQCVGALRVGGGGKPGARAGGERRVLLLWAESDLIAALRDSDFLAAVLDDVKCLAP